MATLKSIWSVLHTIFYIPVIILQSVRIIVNSIRKLNKDGVDAVLDSIPDEAKEMIQTHSKPIVVLGESLICAGTWALILRLIFHHG
jgi:hypothetical protein